MLPSYMATFISSRRCTSMSRSNASHFLTLAGAYRKVNLVCLVRSPRLIYNAQVCFLMIFAEMMRFHKETEQQANAGECGILSRISMKEELEVGRFSYHYPHLVNSIEECCPHDKFRLCR